MNKEEILVMEAGKRLDWEVAQLMGVNTKIFEFAYEAGNYNYSSDISAAWEVRDRMFDQPVSIRNKFIEETSIDIFHINPMMICKAALISVMDL